MKLYKNWALLTLLALTLLSCGGEDTQQSKKRPHDPWVFRSVLDWKPRVVTLALDDQLWAAYATDGCALYKAWQGTVYFDGPVYTQAHGPQPISIGDAYFVNKYASPWFVLNEKGDTLQSKAEYRGHRFEKDQVRLMYEILIDGQKPIGIKELAEVNKSESGQTVFQRVFTTENVPQGWTVRLKTNAASIIMSQHMVTDGKLDIIQEQKITADKVELVEVDAVLTLNSNATTDLSIKLYKTPQIKNENAAGEDNEAEEDAGAPEGARLIARATCKTCHNKNVKTIGPAYVDIAAKYENTEANINMLAKKVKLGGSGVWGNQVMTPHPDIPDANIKKMVSYILSLGGEAKKSDAAESAVLSFDPSATLDTNKLIPGAVVRVYDVPKNTNKIPDFSKLSKPRFAGVMSNFDNMYGSDFKDLSENFAITAKGYLYVKEAGTYVIQLWSDDGSRIRINDAVVVDHDGPHGTSMKETTVNLKPGYYPYILDYYQGGGGMFLSFNWKRPGSEDYEVVPKNHLFHLQSDQGDMAGYSLPMSTVTRIPGDKNPLAGVHPSFDLTQARPKTFTPKVGGMDFMSDGSLIVSTWEPDGGIYRVTNVQSGDPSKMVATKIASGLAEPLGLKVVNDTIYIMQKQELTRLTDLDGDGDMDEYYTVSDDWTVSPNFHEFGFGLVYKEGFFYGTLATAIEPGGASTRPQGKDRGKVVKINKNTGATSFMAQGLRTPNGIGIGYGGDLFVADNQGDWLPSSKIVHVTEGAWFGSRSVDPEESLKWTEKQPVVWLPQDEIGNSPSTPLAIEVGPYKGQMIHGEVTHGGVKRVFVEEVNGLLQGAVFRFTQGLEAGVNRMVWGPDGALYVGGIGNPGNWGQTGKLWYGLQRLQFNGKSTFEMLAVRAKTNGVEIEFTEPLQGVDGWNPSAYEVTQWYYKPTIEYGGPKLDERRLPVKSATVSADRKKVFLEIGGMKKGHVLYLRLGDAFISEKGSSLWSTEAWYTMNNIPEGQMGKIEKSPISFQPNVLSDIEAKDGWKLLFDGKTLNGWKNFRKNTVGSSWVVQDGAIHLNAQKSPDGHWQAKDGGDIVTAEEYEDFELKLEWKIGNCGNSGIMFNVVESDKYNYVWETGPEMQILDNSCHPDTRFDTHQAGDLYDMIACKYPTVKPAGQWNKVIIRSKGGQVSFYQNGHEVVSFTMHDKSWKERIAKSKFKDMPGFGLAKKGKISLQDHGDKVWFRNIKIRSL